TPQHRATGYGASAPVHLCFRNRPTESSPARVHLSAQARSTECGTFRRAELPAIGANGLVKATVVSPRLLHHAVGRAALVLPPVTRKCARHSRPSPNRSSPK